MQKKALVVDDNKSNLMLEADLLQVSGFLVLEAETADEGIAVARREKPDIIVMDVRLSDMRGTEAARILRRCRETRGIPIVFVTASVPAGELPEINTITKSGLIGKPIDTRTFAMEIHKLLRKFSPAVVTSH